MCLSRWLGRDRGRAFSAAPWLILVASRSSGAVQEIADHHELVVAKLDHIAVLDRTIVGGRCIELDAGHQERQRDVLEVRGLRHDVLAAQIVLALLEHHDSAWATM